MVASQPGNLRGHRSGCFLPTKGLSSNQLWLYLSSPGGGGRGEWGCDLGKGCYQRPGATSLWNLSQLGSARPANCSICFIVVLNFMCQRKSMNKRLLLRHIPLLISLMAFKKISRNCLKHSVFIIKYQPFILFYIFFFWLYVAIFPATFWHTGTLTVGPVVQEAHPSL